MRANEITAADARKAGFAERAALLRLVGDRRPSDLYRIGFHYAGAGDPRAKLAADGRLSAEDVQQLTKRLRAMDERSSTGSWTSETLMLISQRPGIVSSELARRLGMERAIFKTNVRKLKTLGLTISLETGYQLSPRGQAFLGRRARPR